MYGDQGFVIAEIFGYNESDMEIFIYFRPDLLGLHMRVKGSGFINEVFEQS